jgi:hypothetical protein
VSPKRPKRSAGCYTPGAVVILTIWLAMMGTGALCYPRRPRTSGVLFLISGGFMLAVWVAGMIGDAPPVVAVTSLGLGLGNLWRFHDPIVRAAHVAEWRGRA